MLTQCPRCQAIYRVRAGELSAANGFVICDTCETQFNALQRLADEPPAQQPNVGCAPPHKESEPEILPAKIENSSDLHASASTDEEISLEHPPILNDASTAELFEVPAVLRRDIDRLSRRRGVSAKNAMWSLLVLIALLGLGSQLSWAYRDALLQRFPGIRPYLERWCTIFDCRFEKKLSVGEIELVAREVREHPQYTNSLLINATLINRSAHVARYPLVQLSIYDHAGNVIGIRRFQPREYLDASIDIEQGLAPARNLYVVLELANVNTNADGFEFAFF